jgi:exopolyphosphatase/guanosine-5'-triphosphate,3'-diphosphate pyrophosphatase
VRRLASIDIGSNTILLLVAETAEDGKIFPLKDTERTTRLGRGLASTGRLQPESLKKSLEVIDRYLKICRRMKVDQVLMVGTSALREADNASDLCRAVQCRYGLTVQILSGEQEARFCYRAVEKEMGRDSPLLVMDIGGGSTEIIAGKKGRISDLHSLNLGAVRLTEAFLRSDPVTEEEFRQMMDHVTRNLPPLVIGLPKRVVGLGGTITTISAVHRGMERIDPSLLHGSALSLEDVRRQVRLYKGMSHTQRLRIPGLPRERADVILAGASILLGAMNLLGFERLIVSCHGLRHGLLYEIADGTYIEKDEKSC